MLHGVRAKTCPAHHLPPTGGLLLWGFLTFEQSPLSFCNLYQQSLCSVEYWDGTLPQTFPLSAMTKLSQDKYRLPGMDLLCRVQTLTTPAQPIRAPG